MQRLQNFLAAEFPVTPAISVVVSACVRRLSDHDRRKEVSLSVLVRPREGVPRDIPFREY